MTDTQSNTQIAEIMGRLRGLAGVIRQYGTCAPLALEMITKELDTALSNSISPAELWTAVAGNEGITPSKHDALDAARLCAEAADACNCNQNPAATPTLDYDDSCPYGSPNCDSAADGRNCAQCASDIATAQTPVPKPITRLDQLQRYQDRSYGTRRGQFGVTITEVVADPQGKFVMFNDVGDMLNAYNKQLEKDIHKAIKGRVKRRNQGYIMGDVRTLLGRTKDLQFT